MAEFLVKVSKKSGKGKDREVQISGEMTVINACRARDALLDVFSVEDKIRIDVHDITAIDLTGLQLLCAAHRAALAGSKSLVVTGGDNARFMTVARSAGLLRHVGCKRDEKKTCIWVGGE